MFMDNNQKTKSFHAKTLKNGTIQVQLNNKYEIKQDEDYYYMIQYFIQLINKKNSSQQWQIQSKFQLPYFSTIQFALGKHQMKNQVCVICLDQFEIKIDLQKQLEKQNDQDIYLLPCTHKFHKICLTHLIQDKLWARCPSCSQIFGKMTGDQPDGEMKVIQDCKMQLPGNPIGAFIISYNMKNSIKNGISYKGTSRKAYLPMSDQGKEVLALFREAFDRKLIFTLGTSVTTGLANQTVWNGIHHKTNINGGTSNFGYPDETYLKRVKQELAAKGLTIKQLKK